MLQSVNELYGDQLGASDGDIGHLKDLYFDDRNWVVRYLVADTGSWLPGRQVLISPHALGRLVRVGKALRVHLTRKQVENSPSIEAHKPVSRQYEEEYARYYGLDYYWAGDALWGNTGFPLLRPPGPPPVIEPAPAKMASGERPDAHLRSAKAVNGYHIEANDGTTGHISDFMMDVQTWAIRRIVVKTGHRLSGKEVEIPANTVKRIDFEQSSVFVQLTREAVEGSPAHTLVPEHTL